LLINTEYNVGSGMRNVNNQNLTRSPESILQEKRFIEKLRNAQASSEEDQYKQGQLLLSTDKWQ
jgi:hypothetical protein